jgi:hypothetical protein
MLGPDNDPVHFYVKGDEKMARTERQQIIDHFVEAGIAYDQPIDMAFYLARDRQGDQKKFGSNGYVDQVLKAGYTSAMARQLRDDIKSAVDEGKKPKESKK